jgi:hypothetical protein
MSVHVHVQVVCVCVCVRACARACVCVCVCACKFRIKPLLKTGTQTCRQANRKNRHTFKSVNGEMIRLRLRFLVYRVQRTMCGHRWTTDDQIR